MWDHPHTLSMLRVSGNMITDMLRAELLPSAFLDFFRPGCERYLPPNNGNVELFKKANIFLFMEDMSRHRFETALKILSSEETEPKAWTIVDQWNAYPDSCKYQKNGALYMYWWLWRDPLAPLHILTPAQKFNWAFLLDMMHSFVNAMPASDKMLKMIDRLIPAEHSSPALLKFQEHLEDSGVYRMAECEERSITFYHILAEHGVEGLPFFEVVLQKLGSFMAYQILVSMREMYIRSIDHRRHGWSYMQNYAWDDSDLPFDIWNQYTPLNLPDNVHPEYMSETSQINAKYRCNWSPPLLVPLLGEAPDVPGAVTRQRKRHHAGHRPVSALPE